MEGYKPQDFSFFHRSEKLVQHPTKDESFVILRGKVRVTTYKDDGSIIEDVVLSQEIGNYGVDIPKNVWHKLNSEED